MGFNWLRCLKYSEITSFIVGIYGNERTMVNQPTLKLGANDSCDTCETGGVDLMVWFLEKPTCPLVI